MCTWREKAQSIGLLWLRVFTGVGIASLHGYGKVLGGNIERFTEGVAKMGFPMPDVFAWIAALSEFVGGILIVLGLGTRIAALFVMGTVGVAAFVRHAADPFDVKEMALLYFAMAGAIVLLGAGKISLDYLLGKAFCKKKQPV